ncbi:hypothetical protein ACVWW2_003255 [Bradyrhizobium sp. LM4.3]
MPATTQPQHCVIRRQLDHAHRHFVSPCVPVFKPLAMRASVFEDDDGTWQAAAFLDDRRMIGSRNNHQLLLEGEHLLKGLIGDGFGNKGCIEIAGENGARENLRIAGAKLQNDPWLPSVVFAEQSRQPDSGRAFHRAEAERSAGFCVLQGIACFIRKREQAIGVAKQHLPLGRQMKTLTLSNEEGHAEILFQLPDTGRHIGLNAMQPLGRAGHAAFAHDSDEYPQIRQIHTSLSVIN